MLYSLIHPGSGLGNQLFRYVAGRVLANDRFDDYSAIGRENFKGKSFMNLDFGKENNIQYKIEQPAGKIVITNPNIKGYIVDDEFQSPLYWEHSLDEVDHWLKVEPIDVPEDLCVIGFRGGEFYVFPELGLPKEYFDKGIEMMREINPNMKFEVHTDDPELAQKFFPDFKVIRDIGINWRSMRYAKYAIIANSSFYILPRILNGGNTIAPRFWARHNTKEWSRPDNYYRPFTYIHASDTN